ncbi:hypothetical protein DSO57_1013779 [Entomophthora muscae]|uniref:Uncharacterized protein n=1 Tax=Entomophthora muscae TaxID=34485 RepID=A0ACC2S7H9_9FUNG|nr:hypothetical protein DSO57_1013779 [Entomophthora muscae]
MAREIARCQEEYTQYGCGPELDIPGLQAYCEKLDICRKEDIDSLPLAAISVKALASILNGFFNELSYKSMIFFVAFMFVWLCASAMLSWLLRPQPLEVAPPVVYQAPPIMTPTRRVRRYAYQSSPQPRARRQAQPSHVADSMFSDFCGSDFDI